MVRIDVEALNKTIERMSMKDKIRLFERLQRETWAKRINNILKNIDQRRKKYKITSKEISQEIEKARKEFYARRS